MATRPEWNADIKSVSLSGPFAVGSVIAMTPKGQDPVQLRIVAAVENESFTDEASFDGAVIRTVHRITPLAAGRFLLAYRTEITGSAADSIGPSLGLAITADFPETMAALVRAAS
ncbi:MAG TPA: polyketide cyclase [Actinocrinis sp.]|uniref:polyketide cyclase n=1 Tax=Actinocrinis sp. TaxID=1920516 RepID=UPI002DDD243F|nr:polyketide cyclase [Actinocrinis sp.]HEV3172819.1 polyketide cyclase [Actinocrinis sp.]